jgi:hypothetical protein
LTVKILSICMLTSRVERRDLVVQLLASWIRWLKSAEAATMMLHLTSLCYDCGAVAICLSILVTRAVLNRSRQDASPLGH